MEEQILTLQDIEEAAQRIAPYIFHTPLVRAATLDPILGCEVYIKPEMLQVTGAFKFRGAANAILSLPEEARKKGVICVSSGNHGKACATVGHLTGTHVTVVLPEDVPHTKIDGVRRMGGEAVPAPRPYEKRMAVARQLMEEHGYTMVHAFEDPDVMAGQGTIGLEVLEDLPELDTIVVPVSGGGLMSGISTAVKGKKPSVRTVGAQAANSDGFAASWRAGKKVRITSEPTIADGLTCSAPSEPDYSIIKKNVDQFITASEENIQEAMRLVAGEVKLLAEPSSCVGIGAFLGGDYHPAPGEKVCFVLSGGNWDVDQIGKVFNHEPVEAVL